MSAPSKAAPRKRVARPAPADPQVTVTQVMEWPKNHWLLTCPECGPVEKVDALWEEAVVWELAGLHGIRFHGWKPAPRKTAP